LWGRHPAKIYFAAHGRSMTFQLCSLKVKSSHVEVSGGLLNVFYLFFPEHFSPMRNSTRGVPCHIDHADEIHDHFKEAREEAPFEAAISSAASLMEGTHRRVLSG
jgi:hypothetical protein